MPTRKPSSFALAFRRSLHLAVLLDRSLEYLNMDEQTVSGLARNAMNVRGSIEKMFQYCRKHAPEAWATIETHIDSEWVDYLQETLDELEEGIDLASLVDEIRKWKGEHSSSKKIAS